MGTSKGSGRMWAIIVVVVLIILAVWYFSSGQSLIPSYMQPAGSDDTSGTASTGTETGSTGHAVKGGKPIVSTTGFASVSSTTAVVVGTVIPGGADTNYWFEYGTTMNLGFKVDPRSAGAGSATVGAAGYITGLKPSTSYYFRIVAKNAYGQVNGSSYNFTTDSK